MKKFLIWFIPVILMLQGCGETGTINGTDFSSSSSAVSSDSASSESSVASFSSSSVSSQVTQAPMLDYGCKIPAEPLKNEIRPLLVIRVNYSDYSFRDSASAWHDKIFGEAPHELNDYYEKISYGHFRFAAVQESDGTNDGIITVSLNEKHPDYKVDDNDNFQNVFQPDLKKALSLSNDFVDFTAYDSDGNGAITPDEMLVMFILSGSEMAFSTNTDVPGIWAHQACTGSQNTPELDGISVMGCSSGGNYAVFGERHIDQCDQIAGGKCVKYDHDATIGIIAHELGHAAFGLPDLYDTSNKSAGIGYFGLMSAGMWGRASATDLYASTPVSMTAWSKMVNGWVQPEVLGEVNEAPASFQDTASDSYNIVLLPASKHECFLIENRSTDGYDAGLNAIHSYYRGGLAIWHIDQSVIDKGMTTNAVNADKDQKGVDLEEAARPELDLSPRNPGNSHNLFWQGNATSFTETTSPDSKRIDGSSSGVRVTDVSAANPVMTAVITNPNKGNE